MGTYGYTIWLVGSAAVLANLGLPAALTKYVAEYVGRGDKLTAARVAKTLIRAQLAMASILAVSTSCLMLFGMTVQHSLIGVAAALLFTQAIIQSLIAILAGIQRFDRIALIGIYLGAAQILSVGVAALIHAGVAGMLWATFVSSALAMWLYHREVAQLLLKPPPQVSDSGVQSPHTHYSRIVRFGLTISYVLLLDTIVWQRSEILFLKWYSTLPEIAIYTIAYSIASKLNDVASTFSGTLLPLYSESHGRSGLEAIRPMFVNALKYIQIIMVFPCLLAAALCKSLVYVVYGSTYDSMVIPLRILLISVAITSAGAVGSPVLVGTGRQSFIAKYGTLIAILNITLDFILIPSHGALGASVANCTAQILGVLGGTIYTIRYVRGRYPWRNTATVYLGATAGVLPVIYCSSLTHAGAFTLTCAGLAGTVLYLIVLAMTKEIGKREIVAVKSAFLRRQSRSWALESGELSRAPIA